MIRFKRIIGNTLIAIVFPGGIAVVLIRKKEDIMAFLGKFFPRKSQQPTFANCFPISPWRRHRAKPAKKMRRGEEIPQWAMCS